MGRPQESGFRGWFQGWWRLGLLGGGGRRGLRWEILMSCPALARCHLHTGQPVISLHFHCFALNQRRGFFPTLCPGDGRSKVQNLNLKHCQDPLPLTPPPIPSALPFPHSFDPSRKPQRPTVSFPGVSAQGESAGPGSRSAGYIYLVPRRVEKDLLIEQEAFENIWF